MRKPRKPTPEQPVLECCHGGTANVEPLPACLANVQFAGVGCPGCRASDALSNRRTPAPIRSVKKTHRNPLGSARRDTATYHPHSVLPAQCVHDLRSEHRSPAASLGTYTVLAVNANQAGELIAYSCTPTVTTDRSALYSERWCMVGGTRSSSFVGGLPPPSGMARVVGGPALLTRHDTWSPASLQYVAPWSVLTSRLY